MQFNVGTQPLLEMARIGYVDDLELIVWTDDPGDIPHFHLRDRATRGKKFHACVRIDKPEYFKHAGKEDTLNSTQKKNLVSFLTSEVAFGNIKITNWEKVIMYWNDNNSAVILDSDIAMPNYLLL